MKIFLINLNISFKRMTCTGFTKVLLCLQFLKNNQLKIIFMPEACFGVQILFSFTYKMQNKIFTIYPFTKKKKKNYKALLRHSSFVLSKSIYKQSWFFVSLLWRTAASSDGKFWYLQKIKVDSLSFHFLFAFSVFL